MKIYHVLFLAILVCVAACDPEKNKLLDPNQISNKTSASSELYFRNVRSLYYATEELPDGKRVYTLKGAEGQTRFSISVLHDWRESRAYVILNTDFQDSLVVSSANTGLPISGNSAPENAMIATHVYNEILQGREVVLKSGEKLFQNETQREVFRKSYYDYLRLVGVR